MSLGKKDIVKNISTKANITIDNSSHFLNKFIEFISLNSKKNSIKISNFGVFYTHTSPKRLGRNPNTKEVFQITQRSKVTFKASNKIRSIIN
tara:strand:+ start:3529 stop:3804 length:276 start_codon:yes stop_codon:yes gene_type:complete